MCSVSKPATCPERQVIRIHSPFGENVGRDFENVPLRRSRPIERSRAPPARSQTTPFL